MASIYSPTCIHIYIYIYMCVCKRTCLCASERRKDVSTDATLGKDVKEESPPRPLPSRTLWWRDLHLSSRCRSPPPSSLLDSPIAERVGAPKQSPLCSRTHTRCPYPQKRTLAVAVISPMEASRYIYTYRIFVSGRVQGVFYRKYTALKATELGVTGFVRNLPDGKVEILAEGTKEQIAALEKWCHTGSPKAQVTAVNVEDCTQVSPPSGGAEATATPPVHRTMSGFVVSR
ncbi:acylphosphatase, putative [Leishmania tarentolae]|uniref:acylphosphatase n=1 Tax=Leishmania tarentolae TaxID=5689 RepID=A0A640KIJ4_LEITA|nr:acylphosphatase, putative [Leishmania tarentolae]